MKKFQTRIELAEEANNVSQQRYAMRIHRMAQIRDNNRNKRIAKKANDFTKRTYQASALVIDATSRVDFTATDNVLKDQLWGLQVNTRKALKKARTRIYHLTGFMGMYRYTLADLTVQRLRAIYKENQNAI